MSSSSARPQQLSYSGVNTYMENLVTSNSCFQLSSRTVVHT